jgi:hypothetical protein
VPRVRTRAHTCCQVRDRCRFPDNFAHRTANELARRAAGYKASCLVCARCRVVSRGEVNAAHNAGDGLACEEPRSRCRSAKRAAAKPAAATRAHRRGQVRTRCHTCAHVPARAHGCATGAAFQQTISQAFAHRTANKLARRTAGYNAWCLHCARCRVVSRDGANAARNVGDGLACEALRRRCRYSACAADKPATATRAHWRQQVRTRCHTCAQVPTRAHGCATGAAFQATSHIAVRTSCRSGQLLVVLALRALSSRVARRGERSSQRRRRLGM